MWSAFLDSNKAKEDSQMQRRLTWVTLLSVAIVLTALSHVRKVHATEVHAHHHGCSVASLKGTYAFRRTGVNNDVGPIAEIGIDVFSGLGTRHIIRSTRSGNGEIQDWANPSSSGSYHVDADCTGSLFDADGTKSNNIIVLDQGKRFFLLSLRPGTIVTAEVVRIDAVEE
jgi:hypothetical protein